MTAISFWVAGTPAPAGSKRAFAIKKGGIYTGKNIIVDDCKRTKSWQATVKEAAREAYSGPLLDGAVRLEVTYILSRPKGHYRSGKNCGGLKPSAPQFPITRNPGDLLKLTRAVEDALTGIIYVDDSQIVSEQMAKIFVLEKSDHFGASIRITTLEG